MAQHRVNAPLRHAELIHVLNSLSNGSLDDFAAHNTRLLASYIVLDPSAAVSVGAAGPKRVRFHDTSMSSRSQVKPLLFAMAGAVTRGLRLISDLLDSSSSSSAGGSSECSVLLTQLPAVHCINTCCSACVVLVSEHCWRPRVDRRSAVEVAVLVRTSGQWIQVCLRLRPHPNSCLERAEQCASVWSGDSSSRGNRSHCKHFVCVKHSCALHQTAVLDLLVVVQCYACNNVMHATSSMHLATLCSSLC
jgi:hypothetical protein